MSTEKVKLEKEMTKSEYALKFKNDTDKSAWWKDKPTRAFLSWMDDHDYDKSIILDNISKSDLEVKKSNKKVVSKSKKIKSSKESDAKESKSKKIKSKESDVKESDVKESDAKESDEKI